MALAASTVISGWLLRAAIATGTFIVDQEAKPVVSPAEYSWSPETARAARPPYAAITLSTASVSAAVGSSDGGIDGEGDWAASPPSAAVSVTVTIWTGSVLGSSKGSPIVHAAAPVAKATTPTESASVFLMYVTKCRRRRCARRCTQLGRHVPGTSSCSSSAWRGCTRRQASRWASPPHGTRT